MPKSFFATLLLLIACGDDAGESDEGSDIDKCQQADGDFVGAASELKAGLDSPCESVDDCAYAEVALRCPDKKASVEACSRAVLADEVDTFAQGIADLHGEHCASIPRGCRASASCPLAELACVAGRCIRDFGTGALGDMACHNMDMAFCALDLKAPTTIEAKSSPVNNETAPEWSIIRYDFPKRGKLAPVSVTWYDGKKKPPALLAQGQQLPANGTLMIGDKGTLFVPHYGGEGMLLPRGDFSGYQGPEPSLPKPVGHYKEWIIACKGGPAALSNFDYAAGLTGMVLLGNLAVRLGKKITWDDEKMCCVGMPEADPLIRREYREGWTI